MNLRRRIAPWFYTILMMALVALFVRLAVWQYHRARERTALIGAARAALHSPARSLDPVLADGLPRFSHVYVVGHYDVAHQLLLAEQPQPDGDDTGYDVLTPIEFANGDRLLVNRGWIPQNGKGSAVADLAAPTGAVRASGYLVNLPEPGVRLGPASEHRKAWPAVLLYPRWSDVERLYGVRFVHRLLLLESDARGGYDRAWTLRPSRGPAENYSYMVQWLGLAAATIVIWGFLMLRARRRLAVDGG